MTEKYDIKQNINRYLDNLYKAEEIDRLLELIRSEIDSPYMDQRTKELWIECLHSYNGNLPEAEALKKEALLLIEKTEPSYPKTKNRKIPYWTRIAASVAILVAISLTVYLKKSGQSDDVASTYIELKVPYGDRKTIILEDGSQVILNAGTTIRYPEKFTEEERNVYLDGEAFFSVTPNLSQPFIVTSNSMTVQVLGTEFNVKTYGEDELASISVKSGKVSVDTEDMSSKLTQGDQITLNNRTKDYLKKKVELHRITSWVKGNLVFYETPINDVAKELTRIYNCNIRFEEGQSFNNLIIGEHDNKNLEAVLKSIEYTSGIKFRKEGTDYILYK